MNKKFGIIILSIVLFVLVILLINNVNGNKKTVNVYTCSSSETVIEVVMNTTYDIYYEEDNINKIKINKAYKGTTTKGQENLSNYRYLVSTENSQYSEINGFSYKINKDTKKEYNYTYTFDMKKIKEEDVMSLFGIFKTFNEQKEYLNNNNYTCKDK